MARNADTVRQGFHAFNGVIEPRTSGLELDSPTGWVLTVREGKIVKAEGFLSRDEALQAAGLVE